ncbi:MAG: GIY-YIG nuclease family protein [Candidatus Omnitrophica bacterium]|nr:GIY-YIG nuclease family protein [Candidatus Omnitrophota bacterium]
MASYYVYILASRANGTLYLGVTNDLVKSVYQHRNNLLEGYTSKYCVHRLVYFEETEDVHSALSREKRIKKWNRAWKIRLIEDRNPDWKDLYSEILGN